MYSPSISVGISIGKDKQKDQYFKIISNLLEDGKINEVKLLMEKMGYDKKSITEFLKMPVSESKCLALQASENNSQNWKDVSELLDSEKFSEAKILLEKMGMGAGTLIQELFDLPADRRKNMLLIMQRMMKGL
jgi:hypothetical protein